jgi:adenylate cyclase
VAAIEPNLVLAEVERARSKPTENLQAYDLCLRALPLTIRPSLAEVEQALAVLQRAISFDPGYSYAKSLFAWAHTIAVFNHLISHERGASALPYAEQALQDHRDDPTTLAFAGHSLSRLARRHEAALFALDRALALNPNSITALRSAGWVRLYVGDFEPAIEHFERAMHLNPLDPEIGFVLGGKAFAFIQAGRANEAVALARRALVEMPASSSSHIALTTALAAAGRWDEVPQASAEHMRIRYPTIGTFTALAPWTFAPYQALVIDTCGDWVCRSSTRLRCAMLILSSDSSSAHRGRLGRQFRRHARARPPGLGRCVAAVKIGVERLLSGIHTEWLVMAAC